MKKGLLFLVAAVALLFSCSDLSHDSENIVKNSLDGGTYLLIGSTSVQRSSVPGSNDADVNRLTSFVLKGSWDGGDYVALAGGDTPIESLDELTQTRIPIQTGNWVFTLTAELDGVPFSGTTASTLIEAGKDNVVSFRLSASEDYGNYGGLSMAVQFYDDTGTVASVVATLKNADESLNLDVQTFTTDDYVEEKPGTGVYSVTYTRSASDMANRLETGTYYLVFNFYADGMTTPLNSLDYYVRVARGITTTSSQTVKLNEVFTIEYEYNGGQLPAGTVLPLKYSRKSDTIELPTMEIIERTDWIFDGWYTDAAFTEGNEISEIATGSNGDLKLYAKWHKQTTESNSFTVTINASPDNDIEVTNNIDSAIQNKNPEIVLEAPSTLDGKELNFAWKVDGEEVSVPDTEPYKLTLDASSWATGVYNVLLIATDSDGKERSYQAQIDWKRLYRVEIQTNDSTVAAVNDVQYIVEGEKVSEPELIKGDGTTAEQPLYGWYLDENFTEKYNFNSAVKENITLYACWKLTTIYVMAFDDPDYTGDGSVDNPFKTIEAAVDLITEMDDGNQNYTILVDGTLTGAQAIGYAPAQSITLSGRNGDGTDILDGEFTKDAPGTTLTIENTSCPITITDLTITGGYNTESGSYAKSGGGVYISSYGSVTIGDGTKIVDNFTADKGAGVYIAGGEVIMEGGEISGNRTESSSGGSGGGVYVGATFKMSGGVIKNNSALNDETGTTTGDLGGKGGGVYVAGAMYMYDTAVIGDSSKRVAATATSHSNIANCGGGVYVASGGALYMGYSDYEREETLTGGIYCNYTKYCGKESVYYDGCGGGVSLEPYESSQSNVTMQVASGTIARNTSEHDGGGVYVQATDNASHNSAILFMAGGLINGNICGDGYHGSGVYVASQGDGSACTAKFKMGKDAVVSGENDVYLQGKALITILGELYGEPPVATITPETYSQTTTVLEVSMVTESGMTATTLEKEYEKFEVTPDSSAGGTRNWSINKYGKLITSVDMTALTSQITSLTAASMIDGNPAEVAVSGIMANDDLATITTALSTLCSTDNSILVSLDLSNVVGLTAVPDNAFSSASNLAGITLPDGITSVGKEAFKGCYKLASIDIPEGVETLGASAFESCSGLVSATLPDGLKSMGDKLFYWCTNLETVNLPDTVTSIGKTAFFSCEKLSGELTIPDGVTTLDETFWRCKALTKVNIGTGLESIGEYTFAECTALQEFVVADGNNNMTTENGILFSKDKTKLLSYLFTGPATYTIPDTVTEIGATAFYECTNLTSIGFSSSGSLETIGIRAFYGCTGLENVVLPESVTTLSAYAFCECTGLTSIYIGANVSSISTLNGTFYNCANLRTITVSDENQNYTSEGGVLFNKDKTVLECYPNCPEVYTVPDSVVDIASSAFNNTALRKVTIPVTVKRILDLAFASYAFDTPLTVYYEGSEEQKAAMTISSRVFDRRTVTWVYNYVYRSNKTSPDAVGDIVFKDGTAVAYTEGMTLSDSLKADAVGVVYALDTENKPMGLLGLKNSTDRFVWAPEGTTGYTTSFTDIICVTQYGVSTSEATFDGVTDGSGNWAYICDQDSTGTADAATNYPAFSHVNNYASAAGLTGDYATGWYMPSIAELCAIFNNVNVLNTALAAAGGTRIESLNAYCSSSQCEGDSVICMWSVYYDETSVKTSRTGKDSSMIVLCVRAF